LGRYHTLALAQILSSFCQPAQNTTSYVHAREHVKKLMVTGETFYYQVFYDSAKKLEENVRHGRSKKPDNWSSDWDKKNNL
jgi:hypothetical protein